MHTTIGHCFLSTTCGLLESATYCLTTPGDVTCTLYIVHCTVFMCTGKNLKKVFSISIGSGSSPKFNLHSCNLLNPAANFFFTYDIFLKISNAYIQKMHPNRLFLLIFEESGSGSVFRIRIWISKVIELQIQNGSGFERLL